MSDNEMRIAIAEACGWYAENSGNKFSDRIFNPHGNSAPRWGRISDRHEWVDGWATCRHVPDYLNDLNAMHEAEESLGRPEAFASRLGPILLRDGAITNTDGTTAWHFAFAHATARERAEAFLRTIGKWKE